MAMKAFLYLLALQLTALAGLAGTGYKADSNLKEGQTEFNFFENRFTISKKDSVLVIYDRCDLSGAGVIKKVYYPGVRQTILINNIPAGKYYVIIQCLGKHHDRYERILRIKPGKTAYVSVKLSDYDEFSKDRVIIPQDHFDLARLSVVTMK